MTWIQVGEYPYSHLAINMRVFDAAGHEITNTCNSYNVSSEYAICYEQRSGYHYVDQRLNYIRTLLFHHCYMQISNRPDKEALKSFLALRKEKLKWKHRVLLHKKREERFKHYNEHTLALLRDLEGMKGFYFKKNSRDLPKERNSP